MELITGENDKGRRLDRILRKALSDHPLPLIHRLLRQGQVLVNGKPAKAQDRLDSGVKIFIKDITQSRQTSGLRAAKEDKKSANYTQNSALLSLCEIKFGAKPTNWKTCGFLAVNKPSGLVVHGQNSLETIVRSFLADKLPPSLSFKSGPLHRLDKPSSGIVAFSTSLEGARLFSSLLHDRKIQKTYLAIVEGKVEKEEIWQDDLIRDKEKKKTFVSNTDLNGHIAITKVKPHISNGSYSLIKAEIITGRTHQIRAQAAAHGHPLLGDVKYGIRIKVQNNKEKKVDIFLHAWKLEFLEYSIEAPLPQEFREKITELFGLVPDL